MGLEGISVNQLRSPLEKVSRDNALIVQTTNQDVKAIDGLSSGQKVDPDKENEKNNEKFEFDDENQQDEYEDDKEETIKYDLSDNEKYVLNIDNKNNISIIEKQTGNVVQKINSEELSKFVAYLSNSSGSIVNRRF